MCNKMHWTYYWFLQKHVTNERRGRFISLATWAKLSTCSSFEQTLLLCTGSRFEQLKMEVRKGSMVNVNPTNTRPPNDTPEIRKYKKRFNSEILCAALWGEVFSCASVWTQIKEIRKIQYNNVLYMLNYNIYLAQLDCSWQRTESSVRVFQPMWKYFNRLY